MAGYLDSYGVADERRGRSIRRIVIWSLSVVLVAGGLYLWFRNWRQEQAVKHFFALLQEKNYQEAYARWGCTQDHPCKYWGPEKFAEEWGPSSPYADVSSIKIVHEDSCGNGVVFDIESPKMQAQGLFVDNETNTLSYAPEARCPGRHLEIWEFLKSRFGS
jgi:hypothetical protein